MSKLTEILNSVLDHMAKNGQLVDSLQVGLTEQEIDRVASTFPLRLSDEVYELYQWRNGGAQDVWCDFLPMYRLLSLQEAMEHYHMRITAYQELEAEDILDKRLLPLFAEDCNYFSVLGSSIRMQTASIFQDYSEALPELMSSSLLNFMQAVEECWASGVFRINEMYGPNQYGHFESSYERMYEIFRESANSAL